MRTKMFLSHSRSTSMFQLTLRGVWSAGPITFDIDTVGRKRGRGALLHLTEARHVERNRIIEHAAAAADDGPTVIGCHRRERPAWREVDVTGERVVVVPRPELHTQP